MFGKLLKYEYRSYFKKLLPVWGAILVLALINGFTLPRGELPQIAGSNAFFTSTLPLMLFVISFLVMAVITIVLTLQRFFHGLLGNEGYLMFTLPVSRSQLIGSKLFVSVTVQLIGALVTCLSGLILGAMLGREEFLRFLSAGFGKLGEILQAYPAESRTAVLIGVEFAFIILLLMANHALHLYAAMALGHLSKKQKVAGSVIAWVGLNVLFTNVGVKVVTLTMGRTLPSWLQLQEFGDLVPLFFVVMLAVAIQGAIYWAIAEWILNRKLNLE